MPSLPEHLQRQKGAYKFRMRVPAALQPIIGKREIKRSFGRVDLTEAKRRLSIARLEAMAELDAARRSIPTQPAKAAAEQCGFDDADLWTLMSAWFVEKRKIDATEVVSQEAADLLLEDISYLEDPRDASNTANFINQTTRDFLVKQNLSLDQSSREYCQLSGLIRDAVLERSKRRVQAAIGHSKLELDPRFRGLDAQTVLKPVSNPTLTTLISDYMADKAKQNVNEKTRKKQHARLALFQEMLGPIRVKSIDRSKARKLFADISRLPANLHKRFDGKSVSEVLEMPPSVLEPIIQPITANDYMGAFWALTEFAFNEHIIDRNPASGLRVASDKIDGKKKRLPFTSDDLVTIFNAPIYRGCINDQRKYSHSGQSKPRRARFWIALIALFSGMRQNEICPPC